MAKENRAAMPDNQTNKPGQWLWISLLVIILDQASKLLAETYLNYRQPVPVMPLFDLTLVYNQGAAFSFLSEAGGWQRWFFIALSLVISVVLVIWLGRIERQQRLQTVAIAMVLGGAIGNLIDRSLYGHVIDFIDVYWETHHWPAFNIADSAISVGAVLLILDSFRSHEKDSI
jgi:signal peptidase II